MKAKTVKNRKIRIGFVGAGGMGQCAHLKNYAALKDCELVALAELREDVGARVAARYGVPRVYRTHAEMLANEKLDGIVASQPFTRHGILLPVLLRAGLPVFCEKPLAGSPEIGEQIIAAEKSGGAWLMVGYHKRSDPATMLAKAEIERLQRTRELGALRYIRICMPAGDWVAGGFDDLIAGAGPLPVLDYDPPPTGMDRQTSEAYIGFVNYYIHQVNYLRHLLGEPYTVKYADPSGVLLAARSQSGVGCAIEMTPYQTTLDWQESALVAFEKGYVKIELPAPLAFNRPGRVEFFSDPGGNVQPKTVCPQLPWVHAMRQQAMNFIAAIRGELPPMCGAEEALADLRTAREYLRLWKGV